MPPEVPGPLRDPAIRQSLKTTYGFVIDDGISNLERALRLDPQYDDAMAYMNLLLRQRADLRDTAADSTADIASADQWLQQALEAKRAKTRPFGHRRRRHRRGNPASTTTAASARSADPGLRLGKPVPVGPPSGTCLPG